LLRGALTGEEDLPAMVLPRRVEAEDAAEAEAFQKLQRPYVQREQHDPHPRDDLPHANARLTGRGLVTMDAQK
jgi:hypothetical protein